MKREIHNKTKNFNSSVFFLSSKVPYVNTDRYGMVYLDEGNFFDDTPNYVVQCKVEKEASSSEAFGEK